MSVAMDAREAPILFIILSLFIAVSLYVHTPYVRILRTRIITVNEVHHTLSKPPRRLYTRGSIYFQTKAAIVSS